MTPTIREQIEAIILEYGQEGMKYPDSESATQAIIELVDREIIGENEPEYLMSKPFTINPKHNTAGLNVMTSQIPNKGYMFRNALKATQKAKLGLDK